MTEQERRRRRLRRYFVAYAVLSIVIADGGFFSLVPSCIIAGISGSVIAMGALVLFKVNARLSDVVTEELSTRVMRAPAGLVWVASRRLPEPQRSEVRAEWLAELSVIAAECTGLPVTAYLKRALRSLAFSLDLLRAGHELRRLAPAPTSASGGRAPARLDLESSTVLISDEEFIRQMSREQVEELYEHVRRQGYEIQRLRREAEENAT